VGTGHGWQPGRVGLDVAGTLRQHAAGAARGAAGAGLRREAPQEPVATVLDLRSTERIAPLLFGKGLVQTSMGDATGKDQR
jgi:hypothetical protein